VAAALTTGFGAIDNFGAAGRDLANLDVRFDAALAGLTIAYQPIVSWSRRAIVAYEALVRTREASLRRPDRFVAAAERLGRLRDLGRAVRDAVAATARDLPPGIDVHVNLHPMDLTDRGLFDPAAPLSRVASRVVLELTERTALDRLGDVRQRVEELRGMGFRIALDDLGAGYASLSSLALLRPEQVKLDLSLVRGIARDLTRQVLVGAVREVCSRMGMALICEGVEDGVDLAALVTAGCDTLQGFLFARPTEHLATIDWDRVAATVPSAMASRHDLASAIESLEAETGPLAAVPIAASIAAPTAAAAPVRDADDRSTARFSDVGAIASTLARDAQERLGRLHHAADRLCEAQVSAGDFDLAHEIAVGADHLEGTLAALVELIEGGPRPELR
jgi:EAL domain-containing protein (putative c-di-GMP-specific phosphodiesterase class I)